MPGTGGGIVAGAVTAIALLGGLIGLLMAPVPLPPVYRLF
jgi:hypothetical protein